MGVSVKQLPLIIVLLALYNGDVKCDELVDQNVPEDSQYSTNLHRDGQNEYNSTTVEPWFQPRAWSSTRLYPWGPNDNVKCTGFGRPNDTYEYYSHWRYCDSVSINGNLGFPFQNITYNEVYVCGNGMVQFGYSYMRTYPYLHGRKRSFSLYGLTGAFWGDSDQISLDEYSEAINEEKAKTRVYYQEYQVGDELSEDGKAAMERAQYDVHSIAPSGSKPCGLFVSVQSHIALGYAKVLICDFIKTEQLSGSEKPDDVFLGGMFDVFSGFTPTSLLVVTAVNVAPSKKSCFHHGTNAKLYEHLIAKYYERCFRGWCNSDGAAEWKTLYEQRLSYYRRKSHGCSKNIQSDNWKNHYQTVLITDGYYSFIKFNYPEEGINWVHPDISNYTREFWELFNKYSHSPIYSMSVGGWTASANQQNSSTSFNVLNSGEIWFESVDTYSSWWSTDANNQMINDMSGEYVSIVASYSGISTEIQVCHELLEKMSKRHTSAEMDSFVKKYPCARNLADVLWDEGTFIFHSYHYTTGRYCVYRRVAWSYFGNERSLCCYSMDTNGPENLYLVEGVKLRGGHITDITDGYEEQAKDACCNISIKYCQEFYKSRLPTSSDGYIPVRRVAVRGDPHFTTLDGVDYSFNGQGEFLIFGNSIEEGTIIQARTTRISDNNGALTQATCIQAVAIKFRSFGALQVEKTNSTSAQELGLSSGLLVYFEGRAVNVSGLVSGDRSQTLEGVTSYYRFDRTDDSILIISPDGVQLNVSSAQGLMYFVITVPSDHLNSTEGLLGFYDGNPDNDFMYPERAFHLTERADYWSRYYWAKKWTVSPVASILQYPEGSTPSDYITSPFLPLFIEHLSNFNWNNTELKQRATTECDGNEECLFDVYVTGLLDVGLSTRRIKEETNAITAFLENQPPRINGPSTVDIQKLTALVVRLEIVDEDVKSVIVRATPEELIAISPTHLSSLGLVNITIKTYLFNITESFEFAVIATDEFGKSTIYQPILAYCDCQNGGFCLEQVTDEDLLTSSTNTVIRTCTCLEGWTGQLCETDLDACALSADSCFPGAVCTDKPPPEGIDGFECSGCPPGYEGDGKHCSDINECLNPNYGVCDHECFNAAGSFGCLCNEGYKLTDDRLTCVEVWVRPAAWSSARLYPWGYNARDSIKSTGDGYPMNSSEYYSNWRYCDPVSINGKLGFPFKNRTFIEVYVCGNGMVQFGYNYMWTYPYLHGSHSYFTDYGLAGAFWGNSDQISQDEFAKNINQSDAKTKIFYQEHRDNESLSSDSRTVLMRAKHDVLSVAPPGTDFTPTSVLVITAINIAPNRNYCFHYTTGVKLYEHLIAKYYEHCFGDWCNRDDAQSWRTHYYEKLRYYKEQSIDCAIIQADTLRNHFQTVLITDGYYSFIKFNYPEQGINWVHPDVKEHSVNYRELFYTNSRSIYSMSVGGWSSPDSTYNNTQHDSFNVPDSGHLLFESVDSVKGSAGEHVSRVDSYNGISTNRQSCREFLQSISQTQSPAEMESFIREYPCAGSLSETMWDAGRFKFHSYEYRRRRYCLYRQKRWSYSGNHRALCCYNLNAEEPGYLLLIQGVKQQGGHITDITDEREAEARSVCCSVSFEFCREFYAARPPTSAVGFTPVRRVVARGDPHFTTLDGVDYTFNEQGEYLIFSNGQETGTVIQARTARVHDINGDLTLATRFKAVALQFKNFGAIQFEQENSSVDHISCFVMFFDGAAVNFSGLAIGDTTQTLEGVASYYRFDRTDNSILIISPDGVQLNVSSAQGFMYFAVTVHEDNINSTEGLLGYYDGNPDNDFMYPGRAFHLTKRADHWSRYYWARAWAVAWRVSILRYPEGKTQQDYIGYSFPLFIERLSRFTWANEELKQQATTECDDSEECLFDVYVTGLLDVGLGTKRIWEESRALTTYLENEAPRIDGPSLVYITNNSTSITLQISDKDITTVNISVFPADLAVPDSYGITPEGFISITIQLDLFQINQDLELSVMAVDTFGKTTVYQPTLAYCGCKNGGSCLELTTADDIEMSSTRTIMRTCTCLEGWTGQLCETDLDACALSADSCFPGVLCTDKPPPEEIDGFDCGRCPAGYEGDGKHCSDIDECLDSGYGVCDHECFNAAGSFGCLCFEGFTLNEDGFSCDDIDECQLDICHQHCNNTHGSFICSCVDGWNLLSNNIDCKPANLYKLTNICDHRQEMGWSVRTPNSTSSRYTCVCNRGYQTASNGINCEDIDECSLPTSPCEDTCINEKGGYTCTCPTGFRLGRYGLMCEEQNECGIFGSGLCLQGMLCVDTREGYTCVCPDGSIQEESAGCILLSDDEPSPPSLVPASSEDLASSVVVTFKQLPSILFTVKKRREMYTFIAEVLPNFCGGDGECPAHTRKKRNPSSKQTFYSQDQIITVEGFPSSVGNDLEIAFFVYHASKGYVPASTLKAAIENTQTEIEAIAGAKLTVRDTFEVTPTHTPFIAAQGDAIIAIAAFCGLLMLGLLVFMIIAWRKNKHIVKVDSVPATIVKKEKSKLDEGRLTKVSV